MAGGTWTSQNKKQPGVYINVKSNTKIPVNVGARGVVAICEPLSWGAEGVLMSIMQAMTLCSIPAMIQRVIKTCF